MIDVRLLRFALALLLGVALGRKILCPSHQQDIVHAATPLHLGFRVRILLSNAQSHGVSAFK
jgi:hypothetical protein